MTIKTYDHPSIAAAKADLVYDATDALGYPITCFFSVDATYGYPDRSVGYPGGWEVSVSLIGCQIGLLVLGADDADHALDGNVRHLERLAAEYEADRRNDAGEAA